MTLGELIACLDERDWNKPVPFGFSTPHSYRGYYDQVAFEPCRDTTVGKMLLAVRSALGSTFIGWKGGEFTMDEHTECWLADIGERGEMLGLTLLKFILGEKP